MIARPLIQAVLASLVLSSSAAATNPAPAPRPVCRRFDLTYLPYVGSQGLLGVRPAEIVRDMPELGLKTSMFLDFLADRLPNTNLKPDDFPALAEIDEVVAAFKFTLSFPTESERGSVDLGWVTPFVVHTIHPFAWDTRIKTWFPKAVSARHAGRSYVRIVVDPFPDDLSLCAFCPDGRTLVVAGEVSTKELLDRLAAGGPSPTPPEGWEEVDRNPVALVLDNRQDRFLKGKAEKSGPWYDELRALANSIELFSLGISTGTRTVLKWTVTSKDGRGEITARKLRRIFELAARDLEKDSTEAEMAADTVKNLVLTRDGRRLSGSTSVGRNLFKVFAMWIHGPD